MDLAEMHIDTWCDRVNKPAKLQRRLPYVASEPRRKPTVRIRRRLHDPDRQSSCQA